MIRIITKGKASRKYIVAIFFGFALGIVACMSEFDGEITLFGIGASGDCGTCECDQYLGTALCDAIYSAASELMEHPNQECQDFGEAAWCSACIGASSMLDVKYCNEDRGGLLLFGESSLFDRTTGFCERAFNTGWMPLGHVLAHEEAHHHGYGWYDDDEAEDLANQCSPLEY